MLGLLQINRIEDSISHREDSTTKDTKTLNNMIRA